ncbi:MAG: transcriptional repressor [Muribaculaceae bacterium]|nr:transcriptional repressor [Muribaculaceae bacterium]
MNKFDKMLTEKGIRPTSNRLLVGRELMRASHPISLADLEIALDTIDKASIFRVLDLFRKKEMVHVVDDGSRSLKYELCNSHNHHISDDRHAHFHCDNCGRTFCLEEIMTPVVELPAGFTFRTANYVINGLCPDCSKR